MLNFNSRLRNGDYQNPEIVFILIKLRLVCTLLRNYTQDNIFIICWIQLLNFEYFLSIVQNKPPFLWCYTHNNNDFLVTYNFAPKQTQLSRVWDLLVITNLTQISCEHEISGLSLSLSLRFVSNHYPRTAGRFFTIRILMTSLGHFFLEIGGPPRMCYMYLKL